MGPQPSVTVSNDYIVLLLWDPVQMARTISKASQMVILLGGVTLPLVLPLIPFFNWSPQTHSLILDPDHIGPI